MGGSDEGGVGGVEGGVEGDFGDGGSAGLGFGLDPCLSGSVRLSRIIRIMRPRAIGMLSSGFVPARRGQHPMLHGLREVIGGSFGVLLSDVAE